MLSPTATLKENLFKFSKENSNMGYHVLSSMLVLTKLKLLQEL